MCDYCGKTRKKIEDEYDRYEMQVTRLIPLPAINLTTGEIAKTADPPFYVLFVGADLDEKEDASFPIYFCPMCGRRLNNGD